MRNKFKIIIVAAAAVAALALLVYLFGFFTRPSNLLSYLPNTPDQKQYILVETRAKTFPARLAASLTEGPFALLHKSTSANTLLSLAKSASDTAVLITNDIARQGLNNAAVYAVYKLPAKMSSSLGKGRLPDEWQKIIPEARIEKGQEKGSWEIWSTAVDAPVYYYTDRENVIMAADGESFAHLVAMRSAKNRAKHSWQQERKWPGHIEFGDGGAILAEKTPLKIQFAWRPLDNKGKLAPAGEAKWTLSGLKASHKALMMILTAKRTNWDISEYTIPTEPILVSALNIPKFKGPPEEWPFPLSSAAEHAKTFGLSKNSISDVLSGKTVFSLGGKNRVLWLTLPGILAQFSGNESSMSELVELFWKNLFFDSEPKKLSGWTYGGVIRAPFSVVGAGRADTALLGMISSDSLQKGDTLSQYISKKEKAIGWMVIDLPKLGESLDDMTKVMSLLAFEDGDSYSDSDSRRSYDLDHGVVNAFRAILAKFGTSVIVWERPESGRINWYYPSGL